MCKCVHVFVPFCNVVCTLSGLKLTVHSICAFYQGNYRTKYKFFLGYILRKKERRGRNNNCFEMLTVIRHNVSNQLLELAGN